MTPSCSQLLWLSPRRAAKYQIGHLVGSQREAEFEPVGSYPGGGHAGVEVVVRRFATQAAPLKDSAIPRVQRESHEIPMLHLPVILSGDRVQTVSLQCGHRPKACKVVEDGILLAGLLTQELVGHVAPMCWVYILTPASQAGSARDLVLPLGCLRLPSHPELQQVGKRGAGVAKWGETGEEGEQEAQAWVWKPESQKRRKAGEGRGAAAV